MNETSYPFTLSRTEYRYEFVSISLKKQVRKVVLLSQTDAVEIFNLALLDVLDNGELSDITETKNDDYIIVLATVIQIISDFLNKNKKSYVIFKGSDPRRHRLYRIIMNREFTEISEKFKILGVNNSTPVSLEIDKYYEYYLIGNHEDN